MTEMLYEVRCLKSNEDMIISSFDGAFVVTTPALTTNARKCGSFSKNGATLTLLLPQANIAPKKLTEKPHYKLKNQKNSIHPHLLSAKPSSQKLHNCPE